VPAYDYVCESCGTRFEVRMSMSAYSEGVKPPCEACGSTQVSRAFTSVTVLTGGRAGSGVAGGSSCGGGGFS
jgi:putative FmdB family regulatory protein